MPDSNSGLPGKRSTLDEFVAGSDTTETTPSPAPSGSGQETDPDPTPEEHATDSEHIPADSDDSPHAQGGTSPESAQLTGPPAPLDISSLDPDLQALVREVDDEALRALVDSLSDADDILSAVEEATTDETLADHINVITDHYADEPSRVRAVADAVADQLGMRPFDLTIVDEDRELVRPMIHIEVDDDVVLTQNGAVNADLLAHATRISAETGSGQTRLAADWKDALGEDQLREFKRSRHPDALGFALPEHVPATGDEAGTTPITEIPHIGPARAQEIHPTGDCLSIEDLQSLTDKQWTMVDFPADIADGTQRTRGIVRGLIDLLPDEPASLDVLGHALSLYDLRTDPEADLEWADSKYCPVFGLCKDTAFVGGFELSPVTTTEQDTDPDGIWATTTDGHQARYSPQFWHILQAATAVTETQLTIADDGPAVLDIPVGGYLMLAPQVTDE